jgi:hypothetical protein
MAQKVLEIKATDGIKNAPNNTFFQTVFSEPIPLKAGSSIDMKTAFLDIGSQASDVIEIATNIQLGIEFYRYEYDIAQVPTKWGTDAAPYQKRYIYNSTPGQKGSDYALYIPKNATSIPPKPSSLGYRWGVYTNSNLPAFLLERQSQVINGSTRTEVFAPVKETATINIPAGTYTKQKFTQIVNDQFNLIQGSLTNADKPNELITAGNPPTVEPLDYKIPTNYTGNLLKAYQYPWAQASEVGPDALQNPDYPVREIFNGDRLAWNYWFFPVATEPNPNTYYFNNQEQFIPYIWYYNNMQGWLAGTTKLNLAYDPDNDNFLFDYLHSPIISADGKEVVVFSKSKQYYINEINVDLPGATAKTIGYKANGSMGGILISRLFSYELDNNFQPVNQNNTGFWQSALGFGFDDAASAQFEADFVNSTVQMNFNDFDNTTAYYTTGCINIFNISYPHPKYLQTNTTDSLIPIQWLQQSNYTTPADDYGMAIFSNDIPKVFESIGTRPIFSGKQIFTNDISHYLIEINISHVRNDNFRDQDSYRQIMLIAGKTYSSGSNYVQTFDDGNIQALNLEEDILINKIEVRILNPDKTPATGFGTGTTIYLNLTEPVIVQK